MTLAYVCMKISEYPPPPRVVGGVVGSRAGECGEDPGWNHSYSTRCCPVLLNRLLIRIISLFHCGLPKETPILMNVLFCVVLVPETRDTPFSPPPIPGPNIFSFILIHILLNTMTLIPSTARLVFCLHQSICLGSHTYTQKLGIKSWCSSIINKSCFKHK